MLFDDRGLSMSTLSRESARRYRDGVALTFAAWPGAAEAFDEAITADPGFALPYAARARQYAMSSEPAKAREFIGRAVELVARTGNERERSHVDVLASVLAGRSHEGLTKALAHADAWPRDALILSLPLGAFGLFAFSGMAEHDQARVDLCERHSTNFAADDWWFLTSYGWALAENGEVSRGKRMLERAYELRRTNGNTVHALAHAMFEAGAHDEADALVEGWLPDYPRPGILHGHIAWHGALVALERGDADAALRTYLDHVQPSVSTGMPINIVSDAASLFWRLDAYGYGATAERWNEIAEFARNAFQQPGHAFLDIHMAMIEAATGDREALYRRVSVLEELVANGQLGAGMVVPAFARAALAFAEQDFAACAQILEPVLHEVVRLGGSGAQRQVVEDTFIVALMKSGESAKAAALLEQRLHRRPSERDARWRADLALAHH